MPMMIMMIPPAMNSNAKNSIYGSTSYKRMPASNHLFRTKKTTSTIRIDKVHHYEPREYWERIVNVDGRIYLDKGVELRGDATACALVPQMHAASEEDWGSEYLAPILAVRVVPDLDAAMNHIARYGSQHTDAIVTEDAARAARFLNEVDSSSVMVNASTRFADGFEYGLGAEIGISTDKLHARGPVGLEGLTSQKFVVWGNGEVRA